VREAVGAGSPRRWWAQPDSNRWHLPCKGHRSPLSPFLAVENWPTAGDLRPPGLMMLLRICVKTVSKRCGNPPLWRPESQLQRALVNSRSRACSNCGTWHVRCLNAAQMLGHRTGLLEQKRSPGSRQAFRCDGPCWWRNS